MGDRKLFPDDHFRFAEEVRGNLRILAARGGNIDDRDSKGQSVLHHAVLMPEPGGHALLEAALLALQDKSPELEPVINSRDHDGHSPLSIAVRDGWKGRAELLIRAGACVCSPRKSLKLLHLASACGNPDMPRLVAEGALREGAGLEFFADPDEEGVSPLVHAVRTRRRDMVSAAIDAVALGGSDIFRAALSERDNNGATVLHEAALVMETLEELLVPAVLEVVDVNAADNIGRTPLHWAAESGETGTTGVLMIVGADPAIPDKAGVRPRDIIRRSFALRRKIARQSNIIRVAFGKRISRT